MKGLLFFWYFCREYICNERNFLGLFVSYASCEKANVQTGTFACPNSQAKASQAKEPVFLLTLERRSTFTSEKEYGIL